MKKLFTLLTLLLCVGGAWADDNVLFSTDFTEAGWNSLNNTETAQTLTIGTQVVYIRANNKGNLISVNTEKGILTWGNRNFSNKDCYLAIPVTGVNGSVTVTVYNGTSNTRVTYATSTSSTVANPSSTTNTSSATPTTFTVSNIEGSFIMIYLGRQGSGLTEATSISITTPAPDKTASSENLKSANAVKVGYTALTLGDEDDGYIVSNSTITLGSNISCTSTPSDIKLVKTVTYNDESTEEEDVTVIFDGTVTDGYYIGKASIGLTGSVTEYAVKVKKNVTPTLTADVNSVSVTSYSAGTGSATISLTGANLTGDATVAFASAVEGLSVSPTTITVTDGAVSENFTVSFNSIAAVAENTVNLTFTVGAKSVVVPVTYMSTASGTTVSVSSAKTWNFASLNATDINSADANSVVPFADANGYKDGFEYQYLKGKGTTFYKQKTDCFQGSIIEFTTTVAGYLTVKFSNTGGSRPYRYLYINDFATEYKSNISGSDITTGNLYVPAGTIKISGYLPDAADPQKRDGDNVGETMLNIKQITFTPLAEAVPSTVGSTITECGYNTFSSIYPLDLSTLTDGMTAYVVSSVTDGSAVLTASTAKVPARTGLMIKGAAGSAFTIATTEDATTTPVANFLVPVLSETTIAKASGSYYNYVFGWETAGNPGFYLIDSTTPTLGAGKAYLHTGAALGTGSARLSIGFEDSESTSISVVNIDNTDIVYDMQGRRVVQPQSGLYIVNGRKVLFRDMR